MISSLTLTFLLAAISLFSLCNSSNDLPNIFQVWADKHQKSYPSLEEKLYRLGVFLDNSNFINKHNSLGISQYHLSLNAFADMTHREFVSSRIGHSSSAVLSLNRSRSQTHFIFSSDIPSSVDWRQKGAVTNVKNQGNCGACWSFSATGAVEGINKIVSGSLVSLSEQELIDCDSSYNTGCEGGLMDYAFEFIVANKGIDTEDDYPFRGKDSSCNKAKVNKHAVTIEGYSDVPENNEKQLLKAVARQPVSAGICGSGRTFQFYSSGVFTGPCSTSLDHAVLIVGYGSDGGNDYWIIKNSWGKSWGISGYMKMLRSSGDAEGICGINKLASYPLKSEPSPPPPAPQKCDIFTSCASDETCCCSNKIFGICFSWHCCEFQSSICCKDGRHCCPLQYPVCDTKNNQCLKSVGNATEMVEMKGQKYSGWRNIVELLLE